jgi:hypothetical protein
MERWEFLV